MNLSRLTKNLSLAWMLAKRDFKNRYATSYVGVAWNVLVPLAYALINVVVFSILMKGRMGERYGNLPFALFYFVPFALWSFFAEVTGRSTGILREYSYLINKIAFPFWILPLVPLASAIVNQAIIFGIVGLLMTVQHVSLGPEAWLMLPIWLASVVLTVGVAYAVSALSVYVPDFAQIVPVVVNIMFWLTPILYPATLVESHGALWVRRVIMDYNPFYYIVEMSRHSSFGTAHIAYSQLAGVTALSLVLLFLGLAMFKKLKSGFADVL
jgi:lipopolysaccharide transport system permease protein